MAIRDELAYTLADIRLAEKWTYDEMSENTGLNKTQLIRIINNKGVGVSIDLMENVCIMLGYTVELEII